MCAGAIDLSMVAAKCGLGTYLLLLKTGRKDSGHAPFSISFKNLQHPIIIRPGTDDVRTVIDNIVREEWGNFTPEQEPKLMIDGGAYIGDSSAYFLSRFPGLKVIALEPDPVTFQTMVKNLEPYGPRAKSLNYGLYSHAGTVRFQAGQTGSSVMQNGETEIAVTTIGSVLESEAINRIDILKLDIEGSEEAIFAADPESWLEKVDWLIIEFHSDAGESAISAVLKKNGFTMRQFRSVWYCRRINRNGDKTAA